MAKDERDPNERVAFWREQVAKFEALHPESPARWTMLEMAQERLRTWERKARAARAA